MHIKHLTVENFYSFEKAELDLSNENGLTLIKGKNLDTGGSNGSGKSALIEAFYFGLTGKTIRKSNEAALINNKNKKKCSVTLLLTKAGKDYKIFRGKKPTKLEFFCGETVLTRDTVHSTQESINSILNINDKVLRASMFFGQSNESSFLDSSADDKRVIIRNFLNLEELFEKRDKIKKHKSTFYRSISEQEALLVEHQKTTDSIDYKLADINKAKKEFLQYGKEILDLELEDILKLEEERASLSWQEAALEREINKTEKSYKDTEASLKEPNICPTCRQDTEPLRDKLLIMNEQDQLQSTLEKLKKKKEACNPASISIPISSKEFCKILEYKELCRDETNYEEMKSGIETKKGEAKQKKAKNKVNYDVMRFWEKAFSEQGLIKYIIRNILTYLNDNANYYLSYLTGNKYFIEFDDELNEKIETGGKLVQYISLSGGEKRKVNLAVLLALKDLLLFTDKEQMNLLFFDEVAENLDEEGISGLHSLLLEIKNKKKVFVITHNKYLKTLLDSSPRVSIIKDKGSSTITRK